MDFERVEELLRYFELLSKSPQTFNRLDKVANEIEKELEINSKTSQK